RARRLARPLRAVQRVDRRLPTATGPVDEAVVKRPQQPAFDVNRVADGGQALPSTDAGFLDEVLCVRAITGQAVRGPIEPAEQRLDQLLELLQSRLRHVQRSPFTRPYTREDKFCYGCARRQGSSGAAVLVSGRPITRRVAHEAS